MLVRDINKFYPFFSKDFGNNLLQATEKRDFYFIEMETEVWKDIQGYEGYYQVSNLGRVRGLQRTVKHWRGTDKILKAKSSTIFISSYGYHNVNLFKNGIKKSYLVSRLVAIAFISNNRDVKEVNEVNHINGVKTDNTVKNLEWVSRQENMTHAKVNGLIGKKNKKRIA